MPYDRIMPLLETIVYQIKNPSTRCEILPYESLGRGPERPLKTIQALSILLAVLQTRLCLWLKTQHGFVASYRESKLESSSLPAG